MNQAIMKNQNLRILFWAKRLIFFWFPRSWQGGLCILLFAIITWTSLGHHSYGLPGDESLNFLMHTRLSRDYFQQNIEARAQRDSTAHVALKTEGGFAVFLYLARQLGERIPFVANALLVPLLLLSIAGCIFMTDWEPRRRLTAALAGLACLLCFPGASSLVWHLTHPFRDTLSHTLGFGALLLLFLATKHPAKAGFRMFLAGLMIGLCGWTRLAGFFFAVPAAAVVMFFAEFGTFKRRIGLIAWLGLGVGIGILLLVAQNVFEGRYLLMPPQADKLLLTSTIQPKTAGLIRKGWHFQNLPYLLPEVIRNVRSIYPTWLNLIFLASLAGWGMVSGKRALRLVPLAVGLAVFAGFYGCYDKYVWRYSAIVMLFYAALAGVGLAWMADWLVSGLSRFWRAQRAMEHPWLGMALAVAIATCCLRSGADWNRAQAEWREASAFRIWLRQNVPEQASVWTCNPTLGSWYFYFGGSRQRWSPILIRKGRNIDLSRLSLPAGPAYMLVNFQGKPERIARGWVRDALLNRYDLEPHGEPLRFNRPDDTGVRLFSVKERQCREHLLKLPVPAGPARTLSLYLRDLAPGQTHQNVSLSHDSWPRDWPVQLQAGMNLLAVPEDLAAPLSSIWMRSKIPLPSILDAAWIGMDSVVVRMWDYESIVSHLLQVSDVTLYWDGYRNWERDFGSFSARHASTPWVVIGHSSRLRLPNLAGNVGRYLRLRLSYSFIATTPDILEKGYRVNYRLGAKVYSPAMQIRNPGYPFRRYRVTDFEQEFTIDLDEEGIRGAQWLEWVLPSGDPAESPLALYLNQIEYGWPASPDAVPETASQAPKTRWLPLPRERILYPDPPPSGD